MITKELINSTKYTDSDGNTFFDQEVEVLWHDTNLAGILGKVSELLDNGDEGSLEGMDYSDWWVEKHEFAGFVEPNKVRVKLQIGLDEDFVKWIAEE